MNMVLRSRMKFYSFLMAAGLIFVSSGFSAAWSAGVCRHDLKIELRPEAHRLIGRDNIRAAKWKGGRIRLLLSAKARVKSVSVNGKPSKYSFHSGRLTLHAPSAAGAPLRISISYDAVFDDQAVSAPSGFDNPGFDVTGSIGQRGTFLPADSGWYPGVEGCSQGFDIEVAAPRGTYAVTTGALVGHEDRGGLSISRWKTGPVGQGLSLSAGRYIIRSKRAGNTPVYTYFTSKDEPLSKTYLNAAASYIEFYNNLFGPYPFAKFAIVENFFPSGYGFPSYTLLGGSVLRLPFIPKTSLRHEIAHSWWGNGVLVDYASGNWCEGLTTYVADYLSHELSSAGDARLYRRQILRDYATLAASGRDLPLRLFTSRSSPAARAVGYGKAAFVFHMIRQRLGDRAFWNSLRQIYKERLFVRTSWDDFRDVFVRTGGWDPEEAGVFFDQWVDRSGAPVLKLQDVQSHRTDASGWRITGTLAQPRPWYDLDITIALLVSPDRRIDKKIRIENGSASFSFLSPALPKKLVVDPDVNVFRLLAPGEIPASVNSVKGSHSLLAVLGDGGPSEFLGAYEVLLEGLGQADIPIVSEKEAEMEMGKKRDLLFFGLPRSKKLMSFFTSAPKGVRLSPHSFSVKGFSGAGCLFLVFKNSNRPGGITALFLPASGASADSVLTAALKITHYGKYGYLAFSHGAIRKKGVWNVLRSPLEFDFAGK